MRPADMWPFSKSKGNPNVSDGNGKQVIIFVAEGKCVCARAST
jgi:hypothetical protein